MEFCTGMVGVQCFFAISGFLITTLLLRETGRTGGVSLGGFYQRRALRIFPAYFAYLGVLFLMTRFGSLELARHDWLAALTYTVNYVDHPAWEVNHVWSLSLEEQFYLIWPLAFMAFGPRGGRVGLPVFLALAPVFRVAARVWFRDHAALGYSSTLTGMDSIVAGCLLALLTYDRTLSSQWRLTPPGYIKQ
ncbi:MAG: acyltransferase [Planctomycetaceae bacterium]|nr:acyltransferase [Planctomycetaceae bacterium]